jgi:cation-transporting ATPase 13A3/4/5
LDPSIEVLPATPFELESSPGGLEFLGLIVLQNCLKKKTTPVIHCLEANKIRTVMATGDALLTAVSVAKECGIVTESTVYAGDVVSGTHKLCWSVMNETTDTTELVSTGPAFLLDPTFAIAMTGKALKVLLKHHDHDLAMRIVHQAKVFARMSPTNKSALITAL